MPPCCWVWSGHQWRNQLSCEVHKNVSWPKEVAAGSRHWTIPSLTCLGSLNMIINQYAGFISRKPWCPFISIFPYRFQYMIWKWPNWVFLHAGWLLAFSTWKFSRFWKGLWIYIGITFWCGETSHMHRGWEGRDSDKFGESWFTAPFYSHNFLQSRWC